MIAEVHHRAGFNPAERVAEMTRCTKPHNNGRGLRTESLLPISSVK